MCWCITFTHLKYCSTFILKPTLNKQFCTAMWADMDQNILTQSVDQTSYMHPVLIKSHHDLYKFMHIIWLTLIICLKYLKCNFIQLMSVLIKLCYLFDINLQILMSRFSSWKIHRDPEDLLFHAHYYGVCWWWPWLGLSIMLLSWDRSQVFNKFAHSGNGA